MPIIKYKPTSPSRRFMTKLDNSIITTSKPEKALLVKIKKHSGRNSQGKITVRHQGGGRKKLYRKIDFKRDKIDIPGIVKTIEYDPNRTTNICLIFYKDGEKRYILAPDEIKIGWTIIASNEKVRIAPGNSCPLKHIPEGTRVHNIEFKLKKGGQLARSAGTFARILGKDEKGNYIILKLSSGETRKIHGDCKATIGTLGNKDHKLINLGKAGQSRYLGIRPTVRGSAMNPIDHPHGGGEGKTGIGRKSPLSPWGKKTLGFKTRKKNKGSNKYIIRSRKGR